MPQLLGQPVRALPACDAWADVVRAAALDQCEHWLVRSCQWGSACSEFKAFRPCVCVGGVGGQRCTHLVVCAIDGGTRLCMHSCQARMHLLCCSRCACDLLRNAIVYGTVVFILVPSSSCILFFASYGAVDVVMMVAGAPDTHACTCIVMVSDLQPASCSGSSLFLLCGRLFHCCSTDSLPWALMGLLVASGRLA